MFKIVEKSKIWFSISLSIILIGCILMVTRGLNFGIDFTGGTKLLIELGEEFDKPKVDEIVKKYDSEAVTKTVEDTQYEIKSKDLDETQSSKLFEELKKEYSLEDKDFLSQDQIGPSVGRELTGKALVALFVACIAMLIYIAIRFEFTYGIAALIALVHDVLITLTAFLIFDIPINSAFVAAILTIVGYSINDTIVVFDRIRENSKTMRSLSTVEVANKSINQTLARSLNTSITTLIVIIAVNYFVPTVREFSFPLLIGIATGAFSSIFIASPVWVLLMNRKAKIKTAK